MTSVEAKNYARGMTPRVRSLMERNFPKHRFTIMCRGGYDYGPGRRVVVEIHAQKLNGPKYKHDCYMWRQLCENPEPVDIEVVVMHLCMDISDRLKADGELTRMSLGKPSLTMDEGTPIWP